MTNNEKENELVEIEMENNIEDENEIERPPVKVYTKDDRFIAGLDGLRFLAACWLFWEHMGWAWQVDGWNHMLAMHYRGQIPLQYFF